MKLHPNMNLDIRTQIAILYICTGKYNQFFHEFYTSCERYFLVDQAINKQYFVWTDDVSLCNADNVHLIYHACQGFPADSLFRFTECTALTAFGGLCCLAQTYSMIRGSGLKLGHYFRAKLTIAAITFFVCSLCWSLL